jgi:DNA polymerase-4/DNA polymerase V
MIAHIDADSFFASVLQRKHPHLRGKPLLALGMGGGCVIAASYEAKAKGVRTGMRLKDAMALCPGAFQMPSDFAETGLASQQIEAILQSHCPVMEQMSIDEWFLDMKTLVGGVPFDLFLWAKDLQREVMSMTGMSVSTGVAPTKLLAKMASEYRKPAGVTVVEKRDIETFLADRPAAAIPGIGRSRQTHTKAHRWDTAWDFAIADRELVQKLFGIQGPELQRELLGEKLFDVNDEEALPQSISRTRSFKRTRVQAPVWAHLLEHISYTVLKMRKLSLAARGISVWLRDGEYHHRGLQCKLPQPLDTEEAITPFARKCFVDMWDAHTPCTQAGFALWNLNPRASKQFSLFRDPRDHMREETLQMSLDELRAKYGRDVVIRGSTLPVHKRRARGLDLSVFE